MLSRYHPRVYMYTTYNIGRREKESKIVNVAKTFLRRLLLFISGCYGCNEHAHQFLLAQREKKEKNLGREGLSSDGAFDFEWQRKSEPVLSTIKRERAHRKEEEAELRVHIITVGSLLLPLFFSLARFRRSWRPLLFPNYSHKRMRETNSFSAGGRK